MLTTILTLLGFLTIANAMVSYENYKLYNVVPKTEAEVKILTDLKKEGYKFWRDVFAVGSDVKIMVSPEDNAEFEEYVKELKLNAKVSITNVQELIDRQKIPYKDVDRSSSLGSFTWDQYWDLEHIYNWLDELETLYPDVVTTISIGNTVEGRPIRGVVIDYKPGERGDKPLTAMIEGGIHGNEWIAPATVTWIIKEFLTSTDPAIRTMAETFVWHIFPVNNPDGYAYTFTDDRAWRKNRNPANYVVCGNDTDIGNGVDLNRNFAFYWMAVGASNDPCQVNYAGPSPASEPETQAIMLHALRLSENGQLIYYVAFHSYSQWIMLPYSHLAASSVMQTPNFVDMFEVATRGVEKLKERHGTQYRVGSLSQLIDMASFSGSSFDWAKGVLRVPMTFIVELRDDEDGYYGFLLPPEYIVPNNEEIMDFLVEMDRATRDLGYYNASASVFCSAMSLVLAIGTFMWLQ